MICREVLMPKMQHVQQKPMRCDGSCLICQDGRVSHPPDISGLETNYTLNNCTTLAKLSIKFLQQFDT